VVGHDRWHKDFYLKQKRRYLKQKRRQRRLAITSWTVGPTQSRMVGHHYEVKVEGEWTPVPRDKVNNFIAPDGGADVCAPRHVARIKCGALRRSSS
jgi:hypothetical protein